MVCYGIDPHSNIESQPIAIFPGVMGIMAGIDLLAKFYAGTDEGSSGKRFKHFAKGYIDKEYYEEIYQLRNALLHSFGTFSIDRRGKTYRFTLDQTSPELVNFREDLIIINIQILRQKFEEAIERYRQDLLELEYLQTKFLEMYRRYGFIWIG